MQGSGVRPKRYVIIESDLKSLPLINQLHKYADYTKLLSPVNTPVSLYEDFEHNKKWDMDNKLLSR